MKNQSSERLLLEAYDQHADAIFRFCYAHTGDREQAKDAVQETYVRTWKYLAGGKMIEQIRPFLYRTARNIIIDQHRRSRTESLEGLAEKGFDPADDRMLDPQVAGEVGRAIRLIGQMEPHYREALLLRYVHDLAPREIAPIIGQSENTASVRIHRGLQKLRKAMGIDHE
jgi:RNA polymerase sigma-70 factor (ECF subfamily)